MLGTPGVRGVGKYFTHLWRQLGSLYKHVMRVYISGLCKLFYSENSKRGKGNWLYGDDWMHLPSKFPF